MQQYYSWFILWFISIKQISSPRIIFFSQKNCWCGSSICLLSTTRAQWSIGVPLRINNPTHLIWVHLTDAFSLEVWKCARLLRCIVMRTILHRSSDIIVSSVVHFSSVCLLRSGLVLLHALCARNVPTALGRPDLMLLLPILAAPFQPCLAFKKTTCNHPSGDVVTWTK